MKFVVISKMYSVIAKSLIRSESINLTNLTNLEDRFKKKKYNQRLNSQQ